jgi:4,5-DOPA dioxygenase extradiol
MQNTNHRRVESSGITRRSALKAMVAAGAALPLASACGGAHEGESPAKTAAPPAPGRMPSIFLAHGSPFLLDDEKWVGELSAWAKALPRPKSVLMLSAHWEQRPISLGATRTVPLVYDFYNFPDRYYQVTYAAPGAPELAQQVCDLVGKTNHIHEEPERGLDHGAYVPMKAMYPLADVPVLQVSLPTMEPDVLFRLGEQLAPLRDNGVLIMGSGFLTHNLRRMDRRENPGTPAWAANFDAWAEDTLAHKNVDALLNYREKAPGVEEALPTHEHFVPVVISMGAAQAPGPVTFPITGFLGGSMTRRSVQFG